MRGEVSVFLKRDGKVVKSVKAHNLVTDAVNEFYHLALTAAPSDTVGYETWEYALNGVQNTDPKENILFPMEEKGLGGIMLFDGTLTESTSHVKILPTDPHLVGFANQATAYPDDQDAWRGKISGDSGAITNGYRLVWEWKDEALLGKTIGSLALTNLRAGANYGPFLAPRLDATLLRGLYFFWQETTPSRIFYYDKSGGCVYAMSVTTSGSDTRFAIVEYELTTGGVLQNNGEVFAQVFPGLTVTPLSHDAPCYGFDGYAYYIYDVSTKVRYFKIDLSACPTFTVTLEEFDAPSIAGLTLLGGKLIVNGYFYGWFEDTSHVTKISRTRISDGETEYTNAAGFWPEAYANGNLISEETLDYFRLSLAGDLSELPIKWPYVKEPEKATGNTQAVVFQLMDICSDSVLCKARVGGNSAEYLCLNPGYLGTIYNLPTPITKNSEKETIIVQYDLITS